MTFEVKNAYYGTEDKINETIQDKIDQKKLEINQLTKANLKKLRVDILHTSSHLRIRDKNGKIIGRLKDNEVVNFNGEKKVVKYKNTLKVFLGINYEKNGKIIKGFISADYVKGNITKIKVPIKKETISTKEKSKSKQKPKVILNNSKNTPKKTKNNETVIIETNNQNLPIETNKNMDSKVFSFSSSKELSKRIDKILESKLGIKLSEKLKEKIKLLQNAQLFSNYMKIYASQNNDQDLGTFSFGSNYRDNKPIFIKGAVFPNYTKEINNLMKLGIKGNKNQIKNLLNNINIKKDIKNISLQLITQYKWMPDMENPLDSNSEIEEIYNLIKKGDQIKIAHYFAEKFKDNSFISSSIVNKVNLKGLNLNIITDKNIEEATTEAYDKIHFNFNIFGKNLKLPKKGLSKSDVRELLEETRKDTSSMSKDQRQRYIYGLLVAKQINSLKEYLLSDESKLSLEEKEKLKLYYNDTNSWTEFKQHWKSTIMKGAVIAGTMIITDGLVAGMIPEGAAIGLGGARFATRIATMHNVSGDMSLLVNDQLTGKNALNVALDQKGYLHTAAYMGALEVFGAITGALGKTKFFEKMGGKLEKIGKGKFNLKNLSLYGVNVGGLFTIDMIGFNGKFTPDEIINVLVFASLMGRGNFKATKEANGKIDIKWSKIKNGLQNVKQKFIDIKGKNNKEFFKHKKTGKEYYKENGKFFTIDGKSASSKLKPENLEKIKKENLSKNSSLTEKNDKKIEITQDTSEILKGASSTPIELYKDIKTGEIYTKTLDGKFINKNGNEIISLIDIEKEIRKLINIINKKNITKSEKRKLYKEKNFWKKEKQKIKNLQKIEITQTQIEETNTENTTNTKYKWTNEAPLDKNVKPINSDGTNPEFNNKTNNKETTSKKESKKTSWYNIIKEKYNDSPLEFINSEFRSIFNKHDFSKSNLRLTNNNGETILISKDGKFYKINNGNINYTKKDLFKEVITKEHKKNKLIDIAIKNIGKENISVNLDKPWYPFGKANIKIENGNIKKYNPDIKKYEDMPKSEIKEFLEKNPKITKEIIQYKLDKIRLDSLDWKGISSKNKEILWTAFKNTIWNTGHLKMLGISSLFALYDVLNSKSKNRDALLKEAITSFLITYGLQATAGIIVVGYRAFKFTGGKIIDLGIKPIWNSKVVQAIWNNKIKTIIGGSAIAGGIKIYLADGNKQENTQK